MALSVRIVWYVRQIIDRLTLKFYLCHQADIPDKMDTHNRDRVDILLDAAETENTDVHDVQRCIIVCHSQFYFLFMEMTALIALNEL